MMTQTLDETDLKILRILQSNCRLTTRELAVQIHLSSTPTFERMRRLEAMGFISKYVAVLNAEKLECGFVVFCNILMKQINKDIAAEFLREVEGWKEVTECYNVSGNCDYMMKVYCQSMARYQQFVVEKVGALPYVGRINSIFVMNTLKLTYGIPV